MEKRSDRIKTGLLIIGAALLLTYGWFWFNSFRVNVQRHYYKISLPSANYLNTDNLVTVSGVSKGKIERIEVYPDSVICVIWIRDYYLSEGATAAVVSQGIMGERRINLTLGTGDTIPQWSILRGQNTPGIGELIANTGRLLAHLDTTAMLVNRLVLNTDNQITRSSNELQGALLETKLAIRELKGGLSASNEKLFATLTTAQSALERADSLLVLLNDKAGADGTVNRLFTEEELYLELKAAVEQTNALIEDIRANPDRYLTVKVSIF